MKEFLRLTVAYGSLAALAVATPSLAATADTMTSHVVFRLIPTLFFF